MRIVDLALRCSSQSAHSFFLPGVPVSKLKVQAFSVSIDGYGAGPDQSLENPLGVGGTSLHGWFRQTRTFQEMIGGGDGSSGIDDDIAKQSFANIGAWILGRNMFGPVRGPWTGDSWKGWWGDTPPYHTPVFVLTHHPREPLVMKGGTTFHFVTGGIEEALQRAKKAAQGMDVRVGGGVDTIRQYLQAGLVDEMHLAISPVLLGNGEALLTDIDLNKLGFRCVRHESTPLAMHVFLSKA
jgi:dihydrofolate reductase